MTKYSKKKRYKVEEGPRKTRDDKSSRKQRLSTVLSEVKEGDNDLLQETSLPERTSQKKDSISSILVRKTSQGKGPSSMVLACCQALARQHFSIAFVESATAGKLCYEFSQAPDAGKIFKGGLVCYDACLKQDILHVPTELIEKYTPESAEVTEVLAEKLPHLITCDIAVAVTGLTTAGGSETAEKPVGTVFVHIIFKRKSKGYRKLFLGSPQKIVSQATDYTASLILDMLRHRNEK
jgi:nicotinamide-nucleotide amidase